MELRKISKKELEDILEEHEKYLEDYPNGERANLEYRYLEYADLIYVQLENANLSHAFLGNAYLRRADLSYANLRNSNLKNADLTGANLTRADLSYADLTDANLRYANIWNTNFTGVYGKSIISIQLDTSEQNRVINYIPEIDWVSAGCFHGTLEELKNRVKDVYSKNEKIRNRYEKAIEFIEFLKEDEK